MVIKHRRPEFTFQHGGVVSSPDVVGRRQGLRMRSHHCCSHVRSDTDARLIGCIHKISRSQCNLQLQCIAVFAEKVVLLLCDHPIRDSAAVITLTRGHVRSVAGERATSFAPNVSHGITLTFVNL